VHVQIVTFNLRDISDADYRSACDGLAKAVARVPGLIWMAWLADEPTNTYGGVYTWVDRAAMEDHLHGDFFNAVAADPDLVNITTRDFDLLEGPSRITQALPVALAVDEGPVGPGAAVDQGAIDTARRLTP
jgi:quinol monooxygenase YgiN